MNRRGFLRLLTYTAGGTVAGGLPYGIACLLAPPVEAVPQGRRDARMRLRPPGALQGETAFIEACIGCGLCAEVCPPLCITFYKREGGGNVNTPYIVAEEKSCILCMKCGPACPTDALKEIRHEKQAILKEVDMGIAQIDRLTCYPWVDTGVCGACANVCPLGAEAIGFAFANMYQPIVRDGCVGCGQCVEVCPHPSLPIRIVERSEGMVTSHSQANTAIMSPAPY
jgi:ferredoxin-type protein NapG